MKKLYLLFFIFSSHYLFSQDYVSGFVTDKYNAPIANAVVYFDKLNELSTRSDQSGFFKIDYSGYDLAGTKLVVYKEGYKTKYYPPRKVRELMVVTLELQTPKNIGNDSVKLYEDDVVALDENIIYRSFEADEKQDVRQILNNIKSNFSKNYPQNLTTYKVTGYHSLTEKGEETEDTLLYLKNPLHLELTSYADKDIHLNSKIAVQPTSTLYVRNNLYNISRDSPFFLYEQFSWIDFVDKDFLSKERIYNYYITYEDSDIYEIKFEVKKIQEDSWSGIMTVDKKDFAILDLEVNLEFNRKNSYTIVNKNETKNATSLIYFEGAKIHWNFKKNNSGIYKINSLKADYRIIHVGVSPDYTPQFFVNSKFEFTEESFPEECKILPLNDLLYIAFQKNHANFKD